MKKKETLSEKGVEESTNGAQVETSVEKEETKETQEESGGCCGSCS